MSRRIMYLRSSGGQPVGCIAFSFDRSSGKHSFKISYQVSVLNPHDQFDRALARQIAIGRLVENPITLKADRDVNMHDISFMIMDHIVCEANNILPSRAVKSARLWISKNTNL